MTTTFLRPVAAALAAVPLLACAPAQAQNSLTIDPGQAVEVQLLRSGALNPSANLLLLQFASAMDPTQGLGFPVGATFTASLYGNGALLGTRQVTTDNRYFANFSFASSASPYTVGPPTTIDFSNVLSPSVPLTLLISASQQFQIRNLLASGNLTPDLAIATGPDAASFANSPNYLMPDGLRVVSAVPEPTSALLLAAGLSAVALRSRLARRHPPAG